VESIFKDYNKLEFRVNFFRNKWNRSESFSHAKVLVRHSLLGREDIFWLHKYLLSFFTSKKGEVPSTDHIGSTVGNEGEGKLGPGSLKRGERTGT
jgi:hypothetical protein